MMNRRSFLRGMGAAVVAVAAPAIMVDAVARGIIMPVKAKPLLVGADIGFDDITVTFERYSQLYEDTRVDLAAEQFGHGADAARYVVLVHPDSVGDYRSMRGFVPAECYASRKPFQEESGYIEDMRFVVAHGQSNGEFCRGIPGGSWKEWHRAPNLHADWMRQHEADHPPLTEKDRENYCRELTQYVRDLGNERPTMTRVAERQITRETISKVRRQFMDNAIRARLPEPYHQRSALAKLLDPKEPLFRFKAQL